MSTVRRLVVIACVFALLYRRNAEAFSVGNKPRTWKRLPLLTRCASMTLESSSSPLRDDPRPGMIRVLYAGYPSRYAEYQKYLHQALADFQLHVSLTDNLDDTAVDYIVYNPKGLLQNFTPYLATVKAVFNLQAGANAVAKNPTLPSSIPLCRMMDDSLRHGMVEYVVGHVLRYHLSTDAHWENNQKGRRQWKAIQQQQQQQQQGQGKSTFAPVLAREQCIGILGMGQLGQSCAAALVNLNFNVCGWSRTAKEETWQRELGISCFTGKDGLELVLRQADILVVLLPDTPETQNVINKDTLSKCKNGVCIINVGRGSCLVEDDLFVALDQGQVAGATLDVFATEPLPADHAFWDHDRVLVTPHVAAKSSAATAAAIVAENIHRAETGQVLLYQVNRTAGY